MINKLLTALTGVLLIPALGFSQIDLIPHVGYNFGAKVPIYGGEIKVKGNTTYGINLDYNLDRDNAIQFSYSTTVSTTTIRDYYGPSGGATEHFADVLENYFLLGGVRYFSDGPIQPYGNFNIGAAYYKFTNMNDYYAQIGQTDFTRFAIGFGLGAKIMMSERIGIDVHIRGLAPIQWGGVGIGVGTGGAGAGVYAGSSFLSGDVGGGLIFRLGE